MGIRLALIVLTMTVTSAQAWACDSNGCQQKWNKIFSSGLFDDATVDSDIKKEAAEIASNFKAQCPCFAEEKPRLIKEKLDPILPGLQLKAASYSSSKAQSNLTETKPSQNVSAFDRADVKCPEGSKHVGELPPAEFDATLGKSFEVYCEKDGKRHGPSVTWSGRGVKDPSGKWRFVKANEGEYWKGQKAGVWNLFTDQGTLQEAAEFPTVASLVKDEADTQAADEKERLAQIAFEKKEQEDKELSDKQAQERANQYAEMEKKQATKECKVAKLERTYCQHLALVELSEASMKQERKVAAESGFINKVRMHDMGAAKVKNKSAADRTASEYKSLSGKSLSPSSCQIQYYNNSERTGYAPSPSARVRISRSIASACGGDDEE